MNKTFYKEELLNIKATKWICFVNNIENTYKFCITLRVILNLFNNFIKYDLTECNLQHCFS